MNEYTSVISTSLERAQQQHLEQLSDEAFWDYARQLAQAVPAAAQPTEYLACTLRHGHCLISLTAVYEVVLPPHTFALLPAVPGWMLGIVAWRGETIAAIDLDAYLADLPSNFSARHGNSLHKGILLVVKHAGLPLGLLVPAIGQTTSLQHILSTGQLIQEASPAPLPPWCSPARAAIVQSIQEEALVLHIPTLLADVVQQLETAATYE